MDRLFLNANILFSAAYRPNAGLAQFWQLQDTILSSSHYAPQEAAINLTEDAQRRRLEKLARPVRLDAAPRELPSGLILSEKDVPILFAAMEAKATHLITGGVRHFGRYFCRQIEGILILSPADYLDKRRKQQPLRARKKRRSDDE